MKDTWQPLSDITSRLFAKLEADQRRVFERECERDGVKVAKQPKSEGQDARV